HPWSRAVRDLSSSSQGDQRARHADRIPGAAVPGPMMTWRHEPRVLALAALAAAATACVPVTVNISFPQEKLDTAAKQIEDVTARGPATASSRAATPPAATAPAATAPAATPPAATAPAATPSAATSSPAGAGRTVDVTPRIDTR